MLKIFANMSVEFGKSKLITLDTEWKSKLKKENSQKKNFDLNQLTKLLYLCHVRCPTLCPIDEICSFSSTPSVCEPRWWKKN